MNNIISLLIIVIATALGGCAGMSQMEPTYSYSSQPMANHNYEMPPAGNAIIGRRKIVRSKAGDNFDTLGQRYDVGALELIDANPRYNPYQIFQNSKIVIPEEYILPAPRYRKGIVINIAELRLYYFTSKGTVMTFPVALGKQGSRTPLGKTYVFRKTKSPTWHVPKEIRDEYFNKTGEKHAISIPPGPDNPLGEYAIYLHMKGYLIHGTNNPPSIGRLVSSGCIRMYNDDVKALFDQVKRGTPVNIIYYPNKAGWRDGQLYLESHRIIKHEDGLYQTEGVGAEQAIDESMASRQPVQLNPKRIEKELRAHRGIPMVIGFSQKIAGQKTNQTVNQTANQTTEDKK